MGYLADMTSPHGEVNGRRLLRWLRSRICVADKYVSDMRALGDEFATGCASGRLRLLQEMADDLERELNKKEVTNG